MAQARLLFGSTSHRCDITYLSLDFGMAIIMSGMTETAMCCGFSKSGVSIAYIDTLIWALPYTESRRQINEERKYIYLSI